MSMKEPCPNTHCALKTELHNRWEVLSAGEMGNPIYGNVPGHHRFLIAVLSKSLASYLLRGLTSHSFYKNPPINNDPGHAGTLDRKVGAFLG